MQVLVYKKKDCPMCEKVLEACKGDTGIDLEIKDIEDLSNGNEFNPNALKFLSKQNFRAPLVFVDGEWCQDPLKKFCEK